MNKVKVLVIDDETDFTQVVKFGLEEKGKYLVEIENTPRNALTRALQFEPDIIFLDIIMPELEGPDVLSLLERNEQTKNIPIVFLTATVTKEEVLTEKGLIGGRAFLAKPSTLDELIGCIEKHANGG